MRSRISSVHVPSPTSIVPAASPFSTRGSSCSWIQRIPFPSGARDGSTVSGWPTTTVASAGSSPRSASFTALGLAKASRLPVAVLCTSGTAAANFHPAVIEADESGVPLVVLTGLTMSPAMDSVFPVLLDVFGGRQSARTIHFLCATGIVLFAAVHIFMVIVSGLWNNVRSMITGRYDVAPDPHAREPL